MQKPEKQQKPFEVELMLPVETYDIDFAGIVSNIVYVRWLENLRLEVLKIHWPLDQQMAKGYGPLLASTQIEYKHALRLFDQPVGRMWIAELGQVRWMLQAEIFLGQKLVAAATQTGFYVDFATMRPIPIPEELSRAYLASQSSR